LKERVMKIGCIKSKGQFRLRRENKDHRERALSRGSLRSREKRERERRNQSEALKLPPPQSSL
jgi:hypothetical protein